ncbi:MAG: DNA polymerase/3'-5' exonuclease PolX [Deltaproteobacteria bacterium]
MENPEIANIFYEIADLLEIKGDNPFRVRSYRNAGLAVEGLSVSLKSLHERGGEGLKNIPSIGGHTREKIVEMLTTGRCAFHDELLKEIPSGVLQMLKVHGIGPKKAAVLYKKLGVSSVDALEKAASGHRLIDLDGFGEKSEEKVLKAIKALRAVSGRFRLSTALLTAESIMERLKGVKSAKEIIPAGSLRRWRDSVGDIDLLAISKAPENLMESFVSYPEAKEVISKGDTKSSIVLKNGLQVDLMVVDAGSLGAALQYFTGSKAHNVAIRDRAKAMGLKINEYGVFREKDGKLIGGKTEEDVYKCVGLPWIAPELRENRGEIEAAEKGELPAGIDVRDVKGDLHVHTVESDGASTLEELADAAIKRGYEYLAITDHSKAVGIAHGLDEKRILRQMAEIDSFNRRLKGQGEKFRFLKGAEVDIRADGGLDHPEGVLKRLDCVVGAIHSGFAMTKEAMTGRILNGIRSGLIHILAHPTGRLIGSREPYEIDMEMIMDEAKKYNVAMELNSYPDRLDLNDIHLRLAKEKGINIAISTDSHSVSHLDNIMFGVHTARRGWIEKQDVLNTRPLKEVLKMMKRG